MIGKDRNIYKDFLNTVNKAFNIANVIDTPQPLELIDKLESKKIFDKDVWTGEFRLSAKEVIDICIYVKGCQ